ncbi:MAG: class I SAM-dependent methyltransferase [Bdellovibrionota bacterium]
MSRHTDNSSFEVKSQYEAFPYPPVPTFALPRRGQGRHLRFEKGTASTLMGRRSHQGIRILVAGAGTLEALIVSEAHPLASEVVAVDLSQASLDQLKLRKSFLKFIPWKSKGAPILEVCADLLSWEDGLFDYILASNVLHHCEDPSALLQRLSSWLKPNGILRVVTYPKASRIWMRETSRYLKSQGLHPNTYLLASKAKESIRALSKNHPIRSCFESQVETKTTTGLVDAFFHSCENPLSPLEWKVASTQAGLGLIAEDQTATSRSSFVDEILGKPLNLDCWEKLEILDLTLELCANPILWFEKKNKSILAEIPPADSALPPTSRSGSSWILDQFVSPMEVAKILKHSPADFLIPSRVRGEMGSHLRRASALLKSANRSLDEWLEKLKLEVGPRTFAEKNLQLLPGLSIGEYPAHELMDISKPWTDVEWNELQKATGSKLTVTGSPHANQSLSEQIAALQLSKGHTCSWIPVSFRNALETAAQ